MSEKKRQADRERLKTKRLSESPEDRAARLQRNRDYKRTDAGKKAQQKYDQKRNAKRLEAQGKVMQQEHELTEKSTMVKKLDAKARSLLRDKKILQMERFPGPINEYQTEAVQLAVTGKYAKVRITLCDLADELADHDAKVVLSVLEQQIKVIKEKVKYLKTSQDINEDYAFHLGVLEEREMNARLNKHARQLQ